MHVLCCRYKPLEQFEEAVRDYEQIVKLEDLHGFLSYPEAFPVASIRTVTFEGERRARGFVLREEAVPSAPPGNPFEIDEHGSINIPNDSINQP